jgi:hypothetical protein
MSDRSLLSLSLCCNGEDRSWVAKINDLRIIVCPKYCVEDILRTRVYVTS